MGARPFTDFLREHRHGKTHDDLSVALNELVAAVAETNKGGELVLKVKIKPAGREASGAVIVTDEIQVKAPKVERGESIFFVTPENNLTRQDPNQQRTELREVRGGGELREVV